MRRWPLRWKIALYAAVMGVAATLAGAGTTWLVMWFAETEALDRQIAGEAKRVFALLPGANKSLERSGIEQKLARLMVRDRLLELHSPTGEMVYQSPALDAQALVDRNDELHTRKIGDGSLRVGTFRENGWTLRVAADMAEINHLGLDIVLGMFAAIPTVLIVVTLGGRWVARQALGPVERIRKAASAITIHNLTQRLPMPEAEDEIAGLVTVLNATLDRLQSSFEQSVRFSADASHQLKTPISVLRAGIEEILTDPATPEKQRARADALLEQVHQLTSTAENLLLLARADAGRLELQCTEFDLGEVLEGLCDDTRALAEPAGLTVETNLPSRMPVTADRKSVSLIAQNLVENAVKYNQRGGSIRITARAIDGHVEVTFTNSGDSIPPERVPYIFDRFYRARGDGHIGGHGLGLSIARELALAQGGDVLFVRSDKNATEFQLRLPHT